MKLLTDLRHFLLALLDGVSEDVHLEVLNQTARDQFNLGEQSGIALGESRCKVQFRILPLPFTDAELAGHQYGMFITPVGFATEFGECNVPAPGPHGYQQRAFYVSKDQIGHNGDLVCWNPKRFDKPWDADNLVPVIVTVLR